MRQQDHDKAGAHDAQRPEEFYEITGEKHPREHGDQGRGHYDADAGFRYSQIFEDDRQESEGRMGEEDQERGRGHEHVVASVALSGEDGHGGKGSSKSRK